MKARPSRLSWGAFVLVLGSATGLRAQTWALDPTVAPSVLNDAPVLLGTTFVPTRGGQFLAYGSFTHVNGTVAPGLARLGSDGRIDSSFAAEVADHERVTGAAPLADGRVLVLLSTSVVIAVPPRDTGLPAVPATPVDPALGVPSGESGPAGLTVTAAPLASQVKLVRLGPDGRRDSAYAPLAFDSSPRLLPLSDGGVLAWGGFRTVAGQARPSLVRLDADGMFDASFAPALASSTLSISAVAAASEGGFVLSGFSGNSGRGGAPAYFLGRYSASGALDPRFAPVGIGRTYDFLAVQANGAVLAGSTTVDYLQPVPLDGSGPVETNVTVMPPDGIIVAKQGGLLRYTSTGDLDRTYAVRIAGLRSVAAIAPLPDDRLAVGVTLGSASVLGAPAVFTLTANGQPERDFRQVAGAGEGQRLLAALPDGRLLLLQGDLVLSSSYYPVPFDPVAPVATTAIMPIFLGPSLVNPMLAVSFVDASAVAPLPTSLVRRTEGSVQRLEIDAAGRVLAAGSFTQIDGEPRPGLARFLPGGALDRSFVPAGGELLFAAPNGAPIVRRTVLGPIEKDGFHRQVIQIVRLQTDGALDTGFAFPSTLDAARANWLLAAPDGRLLVAAFDPDDRQEQNLKLIWLGADGRRLQTLPAVFTDYNRYIALPLDASGAPVASEVVIAYPIWYGRPNVVDAAQWLEGGSLLVAGAFGRVDGFARPGLVRLLADGRADPDYAPVIDGRRTTNSALPLPDGRAVTFGSSFVGGRWTSVVQRLGVDGRIDATFQPPPDTIGSGARLLADGSFFWNGRRFLPDGWPDPSFTPLLRQPGGPGYLATAVLAPGGRLWIGGNFTTVGGQARSALARFASAEVFGFTASPRSQTVVVGRDAYFQASVGSSQPATYLWTHDGSALAGASGATLRLEGVGSDQAGVYQVIATVAGRTFRSEPATLTVLPNTTRVINFSARSRVGAGGAAQIAGLVAEAPAPRTVLFRATGYGLPANLGAAVLPVPVLTLQDEAGNIAQDRGGALASTVVALARSLGAFALRTPAIPAGAVYGSALIANPGRGAFMVTTTSGDGGSGLSLFEFYDSGGEASPPLVRNVSLRGETGPGAWTLTAGFTLRGNGPARVLLRGLGPALRPFGVTDAVANPSLALYATGLGSPLAENDDWTSAAGLTEVTARAGAFPLASGSRDAALMPALEPGSYSVQLTAAGATGSAMIEIYLVAW